MTTLREAAQQALNALGEIEWSNNSQWQSDRAKVAIAALRAALAEPDYWQEEARRYAGNADYWRNRYEALAEPPPHQYSSDRMRIDPVTGDVGIGSPFRCTACGGALPTTGRNNANGECVCGEPATLGIVHRKDGPCYHAKPEQEPMQEPFCYHDGRDVVGKEYADHSDVFPLYTAPPQRKPLTDETLWEMWIESPSDVLRFARAIERAHGIGGQDD